MPVVSPSDLIKLRTTQHATRLYLHIYRPATIWSTTVNGAQAAGKIDIAVVAPTVIRTPETNFQVLFGTTPGGGELGEARYKGYVANVLYIGAHNSALPNGAYVTVKEEIKPRSIDVYLSGTDVVYEDGNIGYTDQNTAYMPLARIGCAAVEFRDQITGLATVNFWSNSIAYSGGITAYAWDFKDGVPNTSAIAGTAGAPISVVFNSATPRYVSYTVTANGKTHTRYIPVFTPDRYGANAPYSAVEIKSLSGDVGASGWSASIRVLGDADVAEFPNGALVVLSARDFYGAMLGSIGGQWAWRENIVFQGYIVTGSVEKDAATGAVEFEVEGIGVLAGRLPGLAATFNTGGSGWHNFTGLTYNLAAHHILTQHSTLSQIADCNIGLLGYADNAIDINEGSLQSQLGQAVATPTRGVFGSSAQGIIYLEPDPQLLPVASRTNPTVLDTQMDDFRDQINFGDEDAQKKTSRMELESAQADDAPWFSLAPPSTWDSGTAQKSSGIRADTQNSSNEIAGCLEGAANNQFDSVAVSWRGNYRVFDPFPCEAVNITIAAIQNLRGLAWNAQRCWTKSVSYDYSLGGILLVSSSVSKDSVPSTGITGPSPDVPEPLPEPPNPEPYIPPVPPTPPIPTPDTWLKVMYATTDHGIFYTDDSLAPGDPMPVWVTVNAGLPTLDIHGMTADPFDPTNYQYCRTTEYLYDVGRKYSNRVYRRVNKGTWTKILDNEALVTLFGFGAGDAQIEAIVTNVNAPGYLAVIWNYWTGGGGQTFYYAYSNDRGTTWHIHNTTPIGSNFNGSIQGFGHGLYKGASAYAAGAVVYAASVSGGGGSNKLWVSVNDGATWVERVGFAAAVGAIFAIQLDTFQDRVYCYCSNGILRSTDRAANWTLIADPATYPELQQVGGSVQSGYQLMPLYNPAINPTQTIRAIGNTGKVWLTTNAGTLWAGTTEGAGWGVGLNHHQKGILYLGNADGKIYGISLSGGLAGFHEFQVSPDEGATWTGKAGTNYATPPYTNAIPENAAMRGILPIWTPAP